ncbi:Stomatal closure-related actin-binding protein 1 [Camellia lanceoleosa]|uniref:Stomatal closure-related actin-binding protein 1 n=1 Tax=Camellia lanceoleosa TaxID=1840588 RepID=A0ACC0HY59_9ERIC|nr:Stomatal closure-related actin-binding protein 1 [Camellia lanceoleosa]
MTTVSPKFGDQMQMEAVMSVSVDVNIASNRFPKYIIGADNQILDEAKEDPKGPSLKEVVTQETAQLVEQQKRLSVRDLASKFDKNLAAAAKLSDEAKLREVASLEGHVLLKKFRDALESLRGRLAGRNKEDVEKAISMVEVFSRKIWKFWTEGLRVIGVKPGEKLALLLIIPAGGLLQIKKEVLCSVRGYQSNVRQTLELEGSGLATRKVSWLFYPYLGKVVHDALWFGPIKEEQYIKIGKAIAVLAHGAMCYVMFCSFKELIKDKDYNTVGESVFKSIVKFVLSVFAMVH